MAAQGLLGVIIGAGIPGAFTGVCAQAAPRVREVCLNLNPHRACRAGDGGGWRQLCVTFGCATVRSARRAAILAPARRARRCRLNLIGARADGRGQR